MRRRPSAQLPRGRMVQRAAARAACLRCRRRRATTCGERIGDWQRWSVCWVPRAALVAAARSRNWTDEIVVVAANRAATSAAMLQCRSPSRLTRVCWTTVERTPTMKTRMRLWQPRWQLRCAASLTLRPGFHARAGSLHPTAGGLRRSARAAALWAPTALPCPPGGRAAVAAAAGPSPALSRGHGLDRATTAAAAAAVPATLPPLRLRALRCGNALRKPAPLRNVPLRRSGRRRVSLRRRDQCSGLFRSSPCAWACLNPQLSQARSLWTCQTQSSRNPSAHRSVLRGRQSPLDAPAAGALVQRIQTPSASCRPRGAPAAGAPPQRVQTPAASCHPCGAPHASARSTLSRPRLPPPRGLQGACESAAARNRSRRKTAPHHAAARSSAAVAAAVAA
mmetsp:Transcript_6213/g.19218  ORF Transcript_6213/g.19218 Transcript_6213/m.19218 type:complete len:394 (-) Transcript_6213:258-1439(-)